MLQFVVDHDYDFKVPVFGNESNQLKSTKASLVQKREIKANMKIAGLIEKMRKSQQQMQYYEQLGNGDLGKTLQGCILKQNQLLKILQEEPEYKNYTSGFDSKLGMGQRQLGRSVESIDSKFFDDNKNWIMGEVQKYLSGSELRQDDAVGM